MVELVASELAVILGGKLISSEEGRSTLQGASTDSRNIKSAGIYFARIGDNLDGHDFIQQAVINGAKACVIEKESTADLSTCPNYVLVDDSTKAFGQLAAWWRSKLSIPTLAITGSNGKTTTKELLRALLGAAKGKGLANDKSFNNHVGMPQTILNASPEDNWLVLELGMNHPGELDYLSSIAKPDVAVILNVGPAHIGFFKSIDEIADAKCEILNHLGSENKHFTVLPENSVVIDKAVKKLNRKDLQIKRFQNQLESTSNASACLKELKKNSKDGLEFSALIADESVEVSLPLIGLHNVFNSLAALLASKLLFADLNLSLAAKGLQNAKPADMRLELQEIAGFKVINDAYNANPISMKASLETANSLAQGRGFFAILGEMAELGDKSEKFHFELGVQAVESGASGILAVGNYARNTLEGAKQAGLESVERADSIEDAFEKFNRLQLESGGILLVKGSRASALEGFIEKLKSK